MNILTYKKRVKQLKHDILVCEMQMRVLQGSNYFFLRLNKLKKLKEELNALEMMRGDKPPRGVNSMRSR